MSYQKLDILFAYSSVAMNHFSFIMSRVLESHDCHDYLKNYFSMQIYNKNDEVSTLPANRYICGISYGPFLS